MKSARKIFYNGYTLFIDENVYPPAEDTFLLTENLQVYVNETVLDMGTGCGIVAILAAEKARAVLATDINPYAVKCAKKNAEINCVKNKIDFLIGDLFQPVKPEKKFDLIVFNAPYLPSEPGETESWIGRAWAGGRTGRKVINRFILEAYKFLKRDGRIILVQSSFSDISKTISLFNRLELEAEIIAETKVPFETIVVIEAKFNNE